MLHAHRSGQFGHMTMLARFPLGSHVASLKIVFPSLEKAAANCRRKSESMGSRLLQRTLHRRHSSLKRANFLPLPLLYGQALTRTALSPLGVLSLCGRRRASLFGAQSPGFSRLGLEPRPRCPYLGVSCCGLGSRRGSGLGPGRPPALPFAPRWGLFPGLQDAFPAWPPPPLPLAAPKPRTRPCSCR